MYLGLLRRSSAEPYTTDLSARRWAELLDLDDPSRLGARRVTDAMARLREMKLIEVETNRGEASVITLLREDGSGLPYAPPSGPRVKREDWYLQIPDRLWRGYIQSMSAPALAMLLILLAEPESTTRGAWWSVTNFPAWYGISPSMRAKGTTELIDLRLLRVTKQKLDTPRGANADERDRVRNLYQLIGRANPSPNPKTPAPASRKRLRAIRNTP
ncbi:hypothetical protein EXU48_23780 [Occultella glacieicola]|uniref:Uncharacterized protein n=1 Tax=Occultella glacieicola TaxID=2518684 RepID=A0ABY2DWJ4_9MICO|nr:hypothetical protein [Occultella glacieicola]TDE88146.1 hypothetical protein EXU48_23780 [Occultella glacieicola]